MSRPLSVYGALTNFRFWTLKRTEVIKKRPFEVVRAIHCSRVFLATEGERKLTCILKEKLSPSYVEVRDISGGCGSMYHISIDSELFKGKRTIEQHRMVNEALGDEVKALHGLTLKTGSSDDD